VKSWLHSEAAKYANLEIKYVGGTPRISFFDAADSKIGDTIELKAYDGAGIDALLAERGFVKRPDEDFKLPDT